MKEDHNIGLVYSGGGARGSYQVGVWQALIDLGINHRISAVYGTSVGAINGAAFIQNDIQRALDIWKELHYSKVFANLPNERPSISNRMMYLQWIKGAIRNGGVDVTPLKDVLREAIEEDSIRKSTTDYGLVVFDLTHRRPQYLAKEDIPVGKLVEYIIASSTFPIFQPHRIEDRLYIDGGIYDNRPLSFFKGKKGINKIIVVDVTMARHIWPRKRIKDKIDIYYIRPSRLLGSPMKFKTGRILSNLELGYQDAMAQLQLFDLHQ